MFIIYTPFNWYPRYLRRMLEEGVIPVTNDEITVILVLSIVAIALAIAAWHFLGVNDVIRYAVQEHRDRKNPHHAELTELKQALRDLYPLRDAEPNDSEVVEKIAQLIQQVKDLRAAPTQSQRLIALERARQVSSLAAEAVEEDKLVRQARQEITPS